MQKETNHMSDGAISQDEIDALLSGVDMGGMGASAPAAPSAHTDTGALSEFFSSLKDTFAQSLTTITGSQASVSAPQTETTARDAFLAELPDEVVVVESPFSSVLQGAHTFVLTVDFAKKIIGLINKEDGAELDEMGLSVVSEVISQQIGSEITELSKKPGLNGLASDPASAASVSKAMVQLPDGQFTLLAYPVTLDGVQSTMWEVIAKNPADRIISVLSDTAAAPQASSASLMGTQQPTANTGIMGGGMAMPQNTFTGASMGMTAPNVQSLQYPNLQQGVSATEQGNIGLIMDVSMEMTVELGRTKKQIKEILGMGEGTIIELDKLAGEPVDILVNHKPIAKGEVVVIDENFGVRVTEILSPAERVSDIH